MNTQVNVRMPAEMYKLAKKQAKQSGFGTVQDFIRETLRNELYEELTEKEQKLIREILAEHKAKDDWGSEKELFEALRN